MTFQNLYLNLYRIKYFMSFIVNLDYFEHNQCVLLLIVICIIMTT